MWASSEGKRQPPDDVRSPVDLGVISFIDDLLDDVEVESLGKVLLDEGNPLLCGQLRHCGRSSGVYIGVWKPNWCCDKQVL